MSPPSVSVFAICSPSLNRRYTSLQLSYTSMRMLRSSYFIMRILAHAANPRDLPPYRKRVHMHINLQHSLQTYTLESVRTNTRQWLSISKQAFTQDINYRCHTSPFSSLVIREIYHARKYEKRGISKVDGNRRCVVYILHKRITHVWLLVTTTCSVFTLSML